MAPPCAATGSRMTAICWKLCPSSVLASMTPAPSGPRLVVKLARSEEHTSELQSRRDLVCRLLLEKKKTRLKRRAFDAAAATTAMKAMRGRASFLCERSIDHMDPGALSSCLIVAAVCYLI